MIENRSRQGNWQLFETQKAASLRKSCPQRTPWFGGLTTSRARRGTRPLRWDIRIPFHHKGPARPSRNPKGAAPFREGGLSPFLGEKIRASCENFHDRSTEFADGLNEKNFGAGDGDRTRDVPLGDFLVKTNFFISVTITYGRWGAGQGKRRSSCEGR